MYSSILYNFHRRDLEYRNIFGQIILIDRYNPVISCIVVYLYDNLMEYIIIIIQNFMNDLSVESTIHLQKLCDNWNKLLLKKHFQYYTVFLLERLIRHSHSKCLKCSNNKHVSHWYISEQIVEQCLLQWLACLICSSLTEQKHTATLSERGTSQCCSLI